MSDQVLEPMDRFFDARVDMYDAHMLGDIVGATEFYPLTASLLPRAPGAEILDLGIGTGLEIDEYFKLNPAARVTGIDLSEEMLRRLLQKHPNGVTAIRADYFKYEFGESVFDAAVSVESLHHFTPEKLLGLYKKLCASLKADGCFVYTDYVAPTPEYEAVGFAENERLRREAGIAEDEFYHFDTPLTEAHVRALFLDAGFRTVEKVYGVENTVILVARK